VVFNAVLYTILFQRRLPHAHILIFLKDRSECHDPSQIDYFISVEISNKEEDPIAYATIANYMMHGPCGEANKKYVCMEDHRCTKHCSKGFNSETTIDEDEFSVYRRRDVTQKKLERGSGVDRKFDFLNRCSDGQSETVDLKISLKRDRLTIHMLDSEVGWITYE
jgi:hypothetical protein